MNSQISASAPSAGMIALCEVDDVPFGEGRSVSVGEQRIAIFYTAAGYFAIDNDCPHEGGPLSDGLLADACVTCPLHGRRVDLRSGRVEGRDESVRTYPLQVVDEWLWMDTRSITSMAA